MGARARYTHAMQSRLDRQAAEDTGLDPDELARVVHLFADQLRRELHPGASLTVRRGGRIVLEASGGTAHPGEPGPEVDADTPFLIFSATKPLTAVAVHLLVERGRIDLDAPVARYWPGFAQHGKDAVTIRHVLSHQGGFPMGPRWLTWERWRTRADVVRAMEERPLRWAPGSDVGYHALNFGWVLGELVQRLDGRSLGRFLADEVTGPLALRDSWLGLPPEQHARVARLIDLSRSHDFVADFNRPEVHAAECGAATGITTTRDLSRFYSMLLGGGELDGVRILSADGVARATAVEVETQKDRILQVPVRWALGFNLGGDPSPFGRSCSPETFGHTGQGCTMAWADPTRDLAVAYFTNGVQESVANFLRMSRMSDAILEAAPPA